MRQKIKHSGWTTRQGNHRIIRLYNVWLNMRKRCTREQDNRYKSYGGRGINVCPQWENYLVFKEWAVANGYCKGVSIDRKDNDGNYEPSNCRWIDMKQQMRNRSVTKLSDKAVENIRADTRRPTDIARDHGVSISTICDINKGRTWK